MTKKFSAPPGTPLIVVKRSEQELIQFLSTELGFVSMLMKLYGKPVELEPYQVEFLKHTGQWRAVMKGRQTGFSFLIAAEALAKAHLRSHYKCYFISFSRDEAINKINYVKQLHAELPLEFQKKRIEDSKQAVTFESSDGKYVSSISSYPSKPPRGGSRADIVLDEFAHIAEDQTVWDGSLAVTMHGDCAITVCSTPLGKRGLFYEICHPRRGQHEEFTRFEVPWWLSRFCYREDVDRLVVAKEAPQMTTEERVEKFANKKIRRFFNSMDIDSFQQEFECYFQDSQSSYFPVELIQSVCSPNTVPAKHWNHLGRAQGYYVGGFDLGRARDKSELVVFDEWFAGGNRYAKMVFSYTWEDKPFREQAAFIREMLTHIPFRRFAVDATGMGREFAENLVYEFPCVEPMYFSLESKERWLSQFKVMMQNKHIFLPADRQLVNQLHSIKKTVSKAGNIVYEVQGKGHHADKAYACILATYKEMEVERELPEVHLRIIGEDL